MSYCDFGATVELRAGRAGPGYDSCTGLVSPGSVFNSHDSAFGTGKSQGSAVVCGGHNRRRAILERTLAGSVTCAVLSLDPFRSSLITVWHT